MAEKIFEHDATAACLDELPKIRSYLEVIGDDESLNHDEKLRRVQAILFGWDRTRAGAGGPAQRGTGN